MPSEQDFEIRSGDAVTLEVDVTSDIIDSLYDDATDMEFLVAWSPYAPTSDIVIFKTFSNDEIVIVDPTASLKFAVQLLEADTKDLSGKYYYEARLLQGSNVTTVTVGTVNIIRTLPNLVT